MYWLSEKDLFFPPAYLANEDGILAVGGDLSQERLLLAYQQGIFPWFNPDDPIIWWSPDPRFVLYPDDLKVSKSMRPYFNQQKFQVTVDQEFEQVMRTCQTQRRSRQSGGTWITESMIDGYVALHQAGYAHSIEVWDNDQLVGGLYGVGLGKVFYGESMFAKVSNASKFGFITLVKQLKKLGFVLIDCQQETQHLASLGGKSIPRATFLKILQANQTAITVNRNWEDYLDLGTRKQ